VLTNRLEEGVGVYTPPPLGQLAVFDVLKNIP